MKKPTHFIEVYKREGDQVVSSIPLSITDLNFSLDVSRRNGIETVAIFKIYPKRLAQ